MNRHTPSLIVAPAVDIQYRADDTLGETHAETLQTRTLARLATYADGYDIPVLVTRTKRNDFTASGVTAADHHLECEQTRMGGAGRRRRLRDARLSRRRRCVLPDDVRVLAAAARSARHAGRRGTDDAGAVDADSGRRRDGCHS